LLEIEVAMQQQAPQPLLGWQRRTGFLKNDIFNVSVFLAISRHPPGVSRLQPTRLKPVTNP
jgi:hypothetical protein